LVMTDVRNGVKSSNELAVRFRNKDGEIPVRLALTKRQIDILLVGGLINWLRAKNAKS